MKAQISIKKDTTPNSGNSTLFVQISANKTDTLELLAYGTRSIMEAMDITLMEFLEALMSAKESPSICRTVIDTSLLAQQTDED